jgi:hypothetical protein
MDRKKAIAHVLTEAFSETGIAFQAEQGEFPSRERLNGLAATLAFLMAELADEDSFSREFVSALFILGNRVPDLIKSRPPEEVNACPSLYEQAGELTVAVTALIENWNHWPDLETYEFSPIPFKANLEKSEKASPSEQVGGYCTGDITYCVTPNTPDCFPVRVERLGNGYLEVRLLTDENNAPPEFLNDASNRRFFYPALSPGARLGGEDERLVNSQRKSGPELRLLPVDYASTTLDLIWERHVADPNRWPLPTGLLFERWFQKPERGEEL